MNKILSLILLLIVGFTIVSCGSNSGNNHNPEDTYNPDDTKDEETNGNDGPLEDEGGIENPDSDKKPEDNNPEDTYNPDEPDKPGNEEEQPQGVTLFSHVNELADNVDETPGFNIKESETANYRIKSRKNAFSTNTTEEDITNPEDNVIYQDYLVAGRYFWNSNHSRILNANIFIEQVKLLKEEIINNVKMLNLWINVPMMNSKYRISYDQLNDIVYLEKISMIENQFSYYKISSSYVNNKMVIDTYYVVGEDNQIRTEYCFYYEEDKTLTYYEKSILGLGSIFMLTSDLSHENPINICLDYSILDQGDRYTYEMCKYIYQFGNDNSPGLDISNSYQADYDLSEFNQQNNRVEINNSNNELVLKCNYSIEGGVSFSVDLYELIGYQKLIRGDSYYSLIVGDKEYKSANSDSLLSDDVILFETEDVTGYAYINESSGCMLNINLDANIKQIPSLTKVLCDILSQFGLSFKDEKVYDNIKVLDDSSDILSSYSYFNYSSDYCVSPKEMEQIYQNNKLPSLTVDEIMSFQSADSIMFDEQIEDENYYLLYSNGVTGNVVVDTKNNTLDLSDVSIQLSNTGILTTGENYTLNAYIKNESNSYLIDYTTITYQGETTNINLNKDILLPANLEIGKYTIIAYLTTTIDNHEVRVSGIYTLLADSEYDVISNVVLNEKSYINRIVTNNGLYILCDEVCELKGDISFDAIYNRIVLGNVIGSLKNGYALIDSDDISLIATIVDEENNAILEKKTSFKFGTLSLSAVVEDIEMPVLEEGNYELKMEFKVVNKDNTIIHEESLVQEEKNVETTIFSSNPNFVGIVKLETSDNGLMLICKKLFDINVSATKEENYMNFASSEFRVLEEGFLQNTDSISLEFILENSKELTFPVWFAHSEVGTIDSNFIFDSREISYVETGVYNLVYQVSIYINGEQKYFSTFKTNYSFDIVKLEEPGVEAQ